MKNDGGFGYSKELGLELNQTDHEVKLEDVYLKHGSRRVTKIARKAVELLFQLGVPCESYLEDVENHPDKLEQFKHSTSY